MSALSKEDLLEEKKTIESQLEKLTGADALAEYQDLGTDEDDNAHEVDQFETDTSLVAELQTRLAEINEQLEESNT